MKRATIQAKRISLDIQEEKEFRRDGRRKAESISKMKKESRRRDRRHGKKLLEAHSSVG